MTRGPDRKTSTCRPARVEMLQWPHFKCIRMVNPLNLTRMVVVTEFLISIKVAVAFHFTSSLHLNRLSRTHSDSLPPWVKPESLSAKPQVYYYSPDNSPVCINSGHENIDKGHLFPHGQVTNTVNRSRPVFNFPTKKVHHHCTIFKWPPSLTGNNVKSSHQFNLLSSVSVQLHIP